MESNATNMNYSELSDIAKDLYRSKYDLDDNIMVNVDFLYFFCGEYLVSVESSRHKLEYILIETHLEYADEPIAYYIPPDEDRNVNFTFLPKRQCKKLLSKLCDLQRNYFERLKFMNISKENGIDCNHNYKCDQCKMYDECEESWDDWCGSQEIWDEVSDGMN